MDVSQESIDLLVQGRQAGQGRASRAVPNQVF